MSELFVACARGLRRRDNQDSVLVRSEAQARVLVVADGMGGLPAGDVASGLAIRAFEAECGETGPTAYLQAQCQLASSLITAQAARHVEHAGLGSTLVAAVVRDDLAWIGHVGDSRAYLAPSGGGDELRRLTADHSLAQLAVAAGALAADEADRDSRRHALTRHLGDGAGGCDLSGPVPVPLGAALLLVTDGVYAPLGTERLRGIVAAYRGLELIAALVEAVYAEGAPDNLGIALLERRTA